MSLTIESKAEAEKRKIALKHIASPIILSLISDIKRMQSRLKDESVKKLGFARQYELMQDEFPSLSKQSSIFQMVFDGKMETVVQALYMKDQQDRGLMKQEELNGKIETAFFSKVAKK
jgi:hypothetical protein